MRVVIFALSLVAGVVLFFLFAKLLVAGFFFLITLAVFGFLIRQLRRLRYGGSYRRPRAMPYWMERGYRYPAFQRLDDWQNEGSLRYRTITIH